MEEIIKASEENVAVVTTVDTVETSNTIETRKKEFYKDRKMFYFDNNGNINFPSKQFANSSFTEWFKAIGVKKNAVIRGFIMNNIAFCYIGTYDTKNNCYNVPNLTTDEYSVLSDVLNCWTIYLGARVSPYIADTSCIDCWSGMYSMSIYGR